MRGWAVAAVAVACFAASTAGRADEPGVFKWKDKDGVVHYDDVTRGGQRLTRDYLDKREVVDQPEWAGVIPGEFVAAVEQRCSLSQERLANYRSASALYGRDPSGNTYPLSRTQVKLMVAETQREADFYCGKNAARRIYAQRDADQREGGKSPAAPRR